MNKLLSLAVLVAVFAAPVFAGTFNTAQFITDDDGNRIVFNIEHNSMDYSTCVDELIDVYLAADEDTNPELSSSATIVTHSFLSDEGRVTNRWSCYDF